MITKSGQLRGLRREKRDKTETQIWKRNETRSTREPTWEMLLYGKDHYSVTVKHATWPFLHLTDTMLRVHMVEMMLALHDRCEEG